MTPFFTTFTQHPLGRRYADVLRDSEAPTTPTFALFDDPRVLQRLVDAEEHFDVPPLAGMVHVIEETPEVAQFFNTHDTHRTMRYRQAVGIAILIAMEGLGWRKTGRKGSVRAKWFSRSERYEPNFQ